MLSKKEILERVQKYTQTKDSSSAVYWYNVGYKDAVDFVLNNIEANEDAVFLTTLEKQINSLQDALNALKSKEFLYRLKAEKP